MEVSWGHKQCLSGKVRTPGSLETNVGGPSQQESEPRRKGGEEELGETLCESLPDWLHVP